MRTPDANPVPPPDWTPDSWRARPQGGTPTYPDEGALAREVSRLGALPPLVTSWEIERLRRELAEAEAGKRFVLQGGDCAETLDDCRPQLITNKLKILLQMSLVLVHAGKRPVTRVGRFAGQYAKPRSSLVETRGGVTLPSYFGDLFNRAEFTPEARTPDPALLSRAYQHAALTLNFIRALVEGGFADLHHPEYWDLSFFRRATLSPEVRAEYERMTASLADGLRFMEALGEKEIHDLTRVEFFASHEGLSLPYESSQTRTVPRREGYYCLTTHLPWIGERTRALEGAHVEFFRGVRNPVGVKLGPKSTPAEVLALVERLNPANEAGKLVLITRLGAGAPGRVLPGLIEAVRGAGRRALWMCDPMHANGVVTPGGIKTRSFDAILRELEETADVFASQGMRLGGVHFELTGEDVTECIGGASGVTESDLSTNYLSACDPRLNYQQALEMAFLLARRLRAPNGAGSAGA
ncbi:MAG: 3-deoxy-7-phosphoheptulonate synthase class II [Planctomycetota bacterium]|nr:3-deoxy-7-phosphoheptulonate synthase class II [Planctomycetota bacterium]